MKKKKQLNNYLRFTGIAFQMAGVIGLAVWIGIELDKKYPNDYSLWTIIITLLGVGISQYLVYREIKASSRDDS